MELRITPIKLEEEIYTYSQSSQLRGQTGSIGYLRGDFGNTGKEFYSSWTNYNDRLNQEEFKKEIDEVINSLRSSNYGLLQDITSMNKFVNRYPHSAMKGNYTEEYGFRVDTENHSYLIRCNPAKNDYNFYVFCYMRESLDKHIKDASKGIRFVDSHYNELFRIKDGDKITITLSTGEKLDKVCRYIDEYHTEIGTNLNHICEFAERMEQVGNTYRPKKEEISEMSNEDNNYIIWSNKYDKLDEWFEELKEVNPHLSEDEVYNLMQEINNEYLEDERINLDIEFPDKIVVIANLGLWNGRKIGYKEISSGNIKDCLYSEADTVEWYVDKYGDLRADAYHHDGTNHYLYRVYKNNISDSEKEDFLDKLYYGTATNDDINRVTKRLGDEIANVYGWDIPETKEVKSLSQQPISI